MKQKYNDIVPALREECGTKNPMQTPKLEKIVISVGAGEEGKDNKLIQNMADTISLIAGQKAVIVSARKSVARGENMYNFFDKLVSIALPRVKDFRGTPRKGFDGRGNYNFGLQEQLMFPEVEFDKVIKTHGMNITIVTSTEDDKEGFMLLEKLGMPFAKGRN
jgi:large subunit ribosomal protein L5